MDYAVRPVIRELDCRADSTVVTYTLPTDDPQNLLSSTAADNTPNTRWFETSPVYKRVNFVVKTDSMSTLSGNVAVLAPQKKLAAADTKRGLVNAFLLNEYFEPGQYYTIAAQPDPATSTFSTIQLAGQTRFSLRLDWDIATVSAGIAAGTGVVRVNPTLNQDFDVAAAQKLSISGRSALFGPWTPRFVAAKATKDSKNAWIAPASSDYVALAPGQYSYSSQFSGATTCYNTIPSGTFTVTAGGILDIFVLGSYACDKQSTTLVTVSKAPARVDLGTSVCNPPATPGNAFLFGASSTVSPSFIVAAVAALIALVATMF
jgi:hypothetical protein